MNEEKFRDSLMSCIDSIAGRLRLMDRGEHIARIEISSTGTCLIVVGSEPKFLGPSHECADVLANYLKRDGSFAVRQE